MTDEEFAFKLLGTFTSNDLRELQKRGYFKKVFIGNGVHVLKPLTYCGYDRVAGDCVNYITGYRINRFTNSAGPK